LSNYRLSTLTQEHRQKKFQVGWGAMEKRPKNSTVKLLPTGATEKRPKNSTIKPLFTISVPSMKI